MKKIAKYLLFIMVMEAVLVCFSGCNIEYFKRHKNNNADDIEVIENGDVKYFSESTLRCAPYFNYIIDGIKEMNVGELQPKE